MCDLKCVPQTVDDHDYDHDCKFLQVPQSPLLVMFDFSPLVVLECVLALLTFNIFDIRCMVVEWVVSFRKLRNNPLPL